MDKRKEPIILDDPIKGYLASPYWHSAERVRETRFLFATRAVGKLMLDGYVVFGPITHSHPVSQEMDHGSHRPGGKLGHHFWLNQDRHFLDWADELWILKLAGWEKSYGVAWETIYMVYSGKRIRYLNPDTLEFEDAT